VNVLLQKYPNLFELSVSLTTRGPRPTELHGREYYFVTAEEFKKVHSK
jgi:guanylate kinase